MAKGNGTTRGSSPTSNNQPQTFEEQVDSALVGLKADFFQRMEDYYTNWEKRWQESFAEWKKRNDYINAAGYYNTAGKQARAAELYDTRYNQLSPLSQHNKREQELRNDFGDLTSGQYYSEDRSGRVSFYDLRDGRNTVGDMERAVKATANRAAEKSFTNVRSKMLKTTIEKGIDLKKARVQSAGGDGFYIDDGKIALHARYIMAWGEIKAPHFRFIITDRKVR